MEWLHKNSDAICYVEVLTLDINVAPPSEHLPPGARRLYPKQVIKAKFLKVLKGPQEAEGENNEILKPISHFYFTQGEKLVVYLKKHEKGYQTFIDNIAEWRLASATAEINTLVGKANGGIVANVVNNEGNTTPTVYVLRGRHKSPVLLNSEQWKEAFVIQDKISKLDIVEIPLDPGSYTVLMEVKGNLYAFNRLVDGYYPYITLEKNQWRPVTFVINAIK